jgi:nickel-dependent lactate racemase
MTIALKYGRSALDLDLGEAAGWSTVIEPRLLPVPQDELACVRDALANPIDSPKLRERVRPGQRVVVVTSDVTRPCPSARLLPLLLDELNHGGVGDEAITVVFGLGSHRAHTEEERRRLAGETVAGRVHCVDSDPGDVQYLGRTRRGTPVTIFRTVLEADVRVCLGNIEYHYFAGYSGGAKAIVPGASGLDTIQQNHRMMVEPGARTGALAGNPVREDIDEAGRMVGIDFVLNVLLDGSKRIVDAVAGHPEAAHREGCARLDGIGRSMVDRAADLVIASAGGYPKDIDLYQAQKALDNARQIVQPGGIILLVAECGEGMGNPVFEEWMGDPGGPDAVVARLRREFVLGGHKAAAIALAMQQADVYLVSEFALNVARSMGFHPFNCLDCALHTALKQLGTCPTIVVMPEGASTLPGVRS